MKYSLRVPVTHYQDVKLTRDDLISLLDQEAKSLHEGWDTIEEKNGLYYYYDRERFTSMDKWGEEVPVEILEVYLDIQIVIGHLKRNW